MRGRSDVGVVLLGVDVIWFRANRADQRFDTVDRASARAGQGHQAIDGSTENIARRAVVGYLTEAGERVPTNELDGRRKQLGRPFENWGFDRGRIRDDSAI